MENESNVKIVVLGSCNMDMTVYMKDDSEHHGSYSSNSDNKASKSSRLSLLPLPGETRFGSELVKSFGGKGCNQAVQTAKLFIHKAHNNSSHDIHNSGQESSKMKNFDEEEEKVIFKRNQQVCMISRVGNDMFGDDILKYLHEQLPCLDLNYIKRDDKNGTGTATIFVDPISGENMIVVVPGANGSVSVEDVKEAFESKGLEKAEVLLTQNEIPIETTHFGLKLAHQKGIVTIFNPSPIPKLSDLPTNFFTSVSMLVLNEIEAKQLLNNYVPNLQIEDIGKLLIKELGCENCIITLGGKGLCAVLSKENEFDISIFSSPIKVDHVIDSVGAGDCFTGSLAYFYCESKDWKHAINRAMIAAAYKIQRRGAQSGPTKDQLDEFIQSSSKRMKE